jgi:protein-S-isoprenylcysteine O-methyltransferase Ste14
VTALDGVFYFLWMVYFPIPFYWLLVHPFVEFWRRRRGRTFLAFAAAVWLLPGAAFAATWRFWLDGRWDRGVATYAAGLALLAAEFYVLPRVDRKLGGAALVGWAERDPQQFPPRLIATGLYERVRHPRYLAAMSVTLGVALLNAAPRLVALAVALLPLYWLVTVLEERELVARIGQPYREYQQRVPRLVPRLRI